MIQISPGQFILILIEKSDNLGDINFLKEVYLLGVRNIAVQNKLYEISKKFSLEEYQVFDDEAVINDDPSRRYFETHLALETLKESIKNIAFYDLSMHLYYLYNMLPVHQDNEKINNVLNGKYELDDPMLSKEYGDAIRRLGSDEHFKMFSREDKEKIQTLIKTAYLSVMLASIYNNVLPINIYGKGIYAPENRGLYSKPEQSRVIGTKSLGLMKSYMPISLNDEAYMDEKFSFLRAPDRSTFLANALWVKFNFQQKTHPFGNSISGTMLAQLRLLKYLEQNSRCVFNTDEKMENYLQVFISSMLFISGGHTLHEFVTPLALPEIKENFKFINQFDNYDEKKLFKDNNLKALEKAFDKTIIYHNLLLKKAMIKEDLNSFFLQAENSSAFFNKKMRVIHKDKLLITEIRNEVNRKQKDWRIEGDDLILLKEILIILDNSEISNLKDKAEKIIEKISGINPNGCFNQLSERLKELLDISKTENTSNNSPNKYNG